MSSGRCLSNSGVPAYGGHGYWYVNVITRVATWAGGGVRWDFHK
jgi:hypothetical protein